MSLLLSLSFLGATTAYGQKSGPEVEPAPPPLAGQLPPVSSASGASLGVETWCSLPLCREAQVMRKTGDVRGALKIYQYIQDEVDVDEKVVAKPLLFFTIAALYAELGQLRPASEALEKYKQYIASRQDSDLPLGQRRAEVEQLTQTLRAMAGRLRIGKGLAGVHVLVDGKDVGVTPLTSSLPLAPGMHRIEFSGAPLSTQEIDIPAGQEVVLLPPNVAASRQPLPLAHGPVDEGSGREPRPAWRIAVGSVGIALGLGLIAGSISPLRADGKCANGAMAPCPTEINAAGQPVTRVVDGRTTGGALLGVGIVAAVVGAVVVALPGKKRQMSASLGVHSGVNLNVAMSF